MIPTMEKDCSTRLSSKAAVMLILAGSKLVPSTSNPR